ncbi:MAG: hypothetical protein OXU68_02615 [Bacteroidota bacterium]|nr:hypothetical protein [Bacteroidota bacterium]
MTSAEFAPVSRFNPGELYLHEQSARWSKELVEKWLSQDMFKDLEPAEPNQQETDRRATAIAACFSDGKRWRHHGRGTNLEALKQEVQLAVKGLAASAELHRKVTDYLELLRDYVKRQGLRIFIHSREFS